MARRSSPESQAVPAGEGNQTVTGRTNGKVYRDKAAAVRELLAEGVGLSSIAVRCSVPRSFVEKIKKADEREARRNG